MTSNKNKKLGIYALHPIMYQTPIFSHLSRELKGLNLDLLVLFGDDISLKEVYYEETNVTFKPDTPFLLDGYEYKFLKNYAKDARGGFFSRMNWGVVNELVRGRYDMILLHGFDRFTSFIIIFVAKLTGTKIAWRGENIVKDKHLKKGVRGHLRYQLIKLLFKCFDVILYSCQGNFQYLKHYNVPESKMFSIPCAVNNVFFVEEKNRLINKRAELKKLYELAENSFVVLFAARFTERKRPYDLIDSIKKMNRNDVVILFVGDGPEKEKMEHYAHEKGVSVRFTGFVNQSQISSYYIVADVGIVISREDPSPKAMNEMMNFEIPIIVTDVVGTAQDLVKHEVNGFVVKVGDIDQISLGLQMLYDDKDLRSSMGKKSLEIVSGWNYDKDVDGILASFEYATGTRVKNV